MSKYEPLTDFLKNQITDDVALTFEDMEDKDKIGITLPDSAKRHPQWWENKSTPTTRQCLAYSAVGLTRPFHGHVARSALSFAFASALVCHCMFDGMSARRTHAV
jgi:hypothetical protein